MTRPRIGISCWLPLGHPSGARTRLFGFLTGLTRLEAAGQYEWILLGNAKAPGFAKLHPFVERIPGARVESLPIPAAGRLRVQGERRHLPRACRELGLDVLDLQSLPVPELEGTRILTTIHDLRDRTEWRRSRVHQLLTVPYLRGALQRSATMIVPSPQVQAQLAELLPAHADKVVVVPAGIDVAPESGAPGPGFGFFLHVGRDEARKRLEFLLRAYALALSQHRGLEMLVQVGADRRTRFGRLCRQLGIEQRIVWMGELDDRALQGVLADSIGLVFPSALEGFGLPVLEAMAHGTPCLIAEGGPPAWLAGDGGLALDQGEPGPWAEALVRLSTDAALRRKLGAAARRRAGEFSIEHCTSLWLATIESAVRGASR